jgi:hypothetical protein
MRAGTAIVFFYLGKKIAEIGPFYGPKTRRKTAEVGHIITAKIRRFCSPGAGAVNNNTFWNNT